MSSKCFIIDFDSTFTSVEGLDELAAISLVHHAQKQERQQAIGELTQKAMAGTMPFAQALKERIGLLEANYAHIGQLVEKLHTLVSPSFVRNKDFLRQYADSILIVSSGFKEFIEPIVTSFGIRPENIYANTFVFDQENKIIGYDNDNPLSQNGGKVTLIRSLKLSGEVYVIGDGHTDYEIRAAGLASKFYAFTENVERATVVENADHVAASLDEFLYANKLPMSFSYPKNRINVLLLENIHPHAVEIFEKEGYNVESLAGGLDEQELCDRIGQVSVLGIRSKTQISEKVLSHANRLMAVGAFCIGTNQIELPSCTRLGIAAFNAPYSNTRSVVELAIGHIIGLARQVGLKSNQMHNHIWDKSASSAFEIRGKTLGIVGYGNIGSQLSVLAEALGMKVCYYDIVDRLALGNAQKCVSLAEILAVSDVVSMHVDGRGSNAGLIGKAQFEAMKQGAIFLNLSRGHIVDIDALYDALESKKLLGAALDVFPQEPKTNQDPFVSKLCGLQNLILTPHIGGSTREAQQNIASFVPEKIIQYINTGNTYSSVNFPNLQLPELTNAHRLLHIHNNVPGILAKINNILSANNINILGQYLKTNEHIGYVITDIDKQYDPNLTSELKQISHTIKFRVLY